MTQDALLRTYAPLPPTQAIARRAVVPLAQPAIVVPTSDDAESTSFIEPPPIAASPLRALSPAPEPADDSTAILTVRVRRRGRCLVRLGGETIGRTPITRAGLSAGRHRVVVRCRRGRLFAGMVELQAGEHKKLQLDRRRRARR